MASYHNAGILYINVALWHPIVMQERRNSSLSCINPSIWWPRSASAMACCVRQWLIAWTVQSHYLNQFWQVSSTEFWGIHLRAIYIRGNAQIFNGWHDWISSIKNYCQISPRPMNYYYYWQYVNIGSAHCCQATKTHSPMLVEIIHTSWCVPGTI